MSGIKPSSVGADGCISRLWDLAAGKCMTTLTHHKKSVRALAVHPAEYSFASASAGGNKSADLFVLSITTLMPHLQY